MKGSEEKYSYCCVSGRITDNKTGKEVKSKHSKGYISVGSYLAHRLAWYLYYGEEPKGQIDHINQNKKDNRIINLRCVTNSVNHKNMPIQKNNTTGIVGVHYIKHKKRWVAYIKIDRKRCHLGTYEDFFEACCKRRSEEKRLGFHENHGRLR